MQTQEGVCSIMSEDKTLTSDPATSVGFRRQSRVLAPVSHVHKKGPHGYFGLESSRDAVVTTSHLCPHLCRVNEKY